MKRNIKNSIIEASKLQNCPHVKHAKTTKLGCCISNKATVMTAGVGNKNCEARFDRTFFD